MTQVKAPAPPRGSLWRSSKPSGWWLALIVIGHLVIALTYSVLTPALEGWDEAGHFAFLRHVARPDLYPVGTLTRSAGRGLPGIANETLQPLVYYALVGKLSMPFLPADTYEPEINDSGLSVQGGRNFILHTQAEDFPYRGTFLFIHVARAWNAIFSCFVTLFAFLTARLLAVPGSRLPLVAAALASFDPTWLQMSGLIANDVLAVVFASAALYAMARFLCGRDKHTFWIGLAAALAISTKGLALFLLPVILLAIVYQASSQRSFKKFFLWLGQFLLVIGACTGWWILGSDPVRRMRKDLAGLLLPIIKRGAPSSTALRAWIRPKSAVELLAVVGPVALAFALPRAREALRRTWVRRGLLAAAILVILVDIELPRRSADANQRAITFMFRTFVASFANGTVEAPTWVYLVYGALAIVLIGGLLVVLWQNGKLPLSRMVVAGIGFFGLAASIASIGRHAVYGDVLTLHGRFFMEGLPAPAILLAIPVVVWEGARRAYASSAFMIGLFLFNLAVPFVSVAPSFAADPILSGAQFSKTPHADLPAIFGNQFLLRGYALSRTSVEPGDTIHLTLYWEVTRPSSTNWEVAVDLIDAATQKSVGRANNHPGHGLRPTSTWNPHEIVQDAYDLTVAAQVTPQSTLHLGVAMFQSENGRIINLPYLIGDGGTPGNTYIFGEIRVGGRAQMPGLTLAPLNLNLNNNALLTGIAPSGVTVQAGTQLVIVLAWEGRTAMAARYKVFVHLLDEANHVVAQDDSEPRGNAYPTTFWRPGETVLDPHTLSVPATFQGPVRIEVGMYDRDSLQRLSYADGRTSEIAGTLVVSR